MVKQILKLVVIFFIIGNFLPSAAAQNYKVERHYSQAREYQADQYRSDHRQLHVIKINALARQYHSSHVKTVGHRYIATYRYKDFNQVPQQRYYAMVPSRSNFSSARSFWP